MCEIFQILFWTHKWVLRDCEYFIFPKVKQIKKKLIEIIITKQLQGVHVPNHPQLTFWKLNKLPLK